MRRKRSLLVAAFWIAVLMLAFGILSGAPRVIGAPATVGPADHPMPSGASAASEFAHCAYLKVPSQYPTIQSAINAAEPCDTILVASGTYIGQLTIDKSISIVGSGAGRTIIESPAALVPDIFGTLWTIELGNAATVSLSGFTLLVTLQCLFPGPYYAAYGTPYEGGGIGVGGGAYLNLQSAVVTTTGQSEGGSCGAPGDFLTYGSGIGFGLDYAVGSPSASALIGTGVVSGVTISGFGFAGSSIEIGGQADSPAGSSAVISQDRIYTSADATLYEVAVALGFSFTAETATIVNNFIDGQASVYIDLIEVASGSSAYIAHNTILGDPGGQVIALADNGAATTPAAVEYNSIQVGAEGDGILALGGGPLVVTDNSIMGSTSDWSGGIFLYAVESATISSNIMGSFECELNAALVSSGLCGPDYATEYQFGGINIGSSGPGAFVVTNNLIYNADVGIVLTEGCAQCTVTGNVVQNSVDYGLAGVDGSYTFGPNTIYGGAYGVAAIAYSADTAVTLSHVVMVAPSVTPFYYEVDFTGGTATITGTWVVLP